MKRLVTMTLWVETDGDTIHIHEDTQTHDNEWSDVYRGMIMLRDELQRQIDERKFCPFNPMNVRKHGAPEFDK